MGHLARALPLLVAMLAVGCVVTQHDEARWGTRRVAIDAPIDDADPFLPEQVARLEAEIPALSNWGPTVTEASDHGAAGVFLVRPFNSQTLDPMHRQCGSGSGFYDAAHDVGYCDPTCTGGFDGLVACFAHEWGHSQGLHHVCAPNVGDASCDASIGDGYAVMNSHLGYDDSSLDPTATADPGAVVVTEPTQSDLDEWNATHRADAGP